MKHPVRIYLEKGKTYHFCTCGKSKDGVLCDGTHAKPEKLDLDFLLDE